MRSRALALAAAAGGALALALPSIGAVPTEWTFRVVVSEGSTPIGIPSNVQLRSESVGIDENGAVVGRWTGLTNGNSGLVRYDPATQSSATIVVAPPDSDGTVDTTSTIDVRNGRVGWLYFDNTIRVYDLATGAELYRFTPSGGNLGTWTSPGRFTLTSAGSIGLRASFTGVPTLFTDVFGPPRVQTAAATQTGDDAGFLGTASMNELGQFAAESWPTSAGADQRVRRFQAGQAPTTIFSFAASPGYNAVANNMDINDNGEVAFLVRRDEPSPLPDVWELRRGGAENSSVVLVTDQDPQFVAPVELDFQQPDIANNGRVVFRARGAGGRAVFITDGTMLHRIAGAGDTIQTDIGSITLSTVEGAPVQNEANQVAFFADYNGTTSALILATPVETTVCRPDFNQNGDDDLLDIFAFLEAWFAGCAAPGPAPCIQSADYDGMNGVDLLDIFAFLEDWFAGCP